LPAPQDVASLAASEYHVRQAVMRFFVVSMKCCIFVISTIER